MYKLARDEEQQRKDVVRVRTVKEEDGRVLVGDEEIRNRWSAYFCKLMNKGSQEDGCEETAELVQEDVEDVTVDEVERAVRNMKNLKAVGPDGITAEVWKILGVESMVWLAHLFTKMLKGEQMPKEMEIQLVGIGVQGKR